VPAITLMMEAASTSETSVNLYQITRRNNPGYSHIQTSYRGGRGSIPCNLK
jgi:hypothetical protein